MNIYVLVLKSAENHFPSSCYINKDNALHIQDKMKNDFDTDFELREMSICDSTFISTDVDPSKYKWEQVQ